MATERIKGGYILQPRCYDKSAAAHFPPCTREVWFYLLRNVNYADNGKYRRGGGFFALKDIQDALSWSIGYRIERYSKPQITKALRRLHEGNMIATARATRGVYVTVLNYDKYQDSSLYEGNDEGNTKETRRKHEGMHIEEEGKKERMKEEKTKATRSSFDLDVLPLAIDRDVIAAFIDHRKALKKPMTQLALKLTCDNAMKCLDLYGIDPNEAIKHCIVRGWLACDPKYFEKNGQAKPTGTDKCKTCQYTSSPKCQTRTKTQKEACTAWQQS